MNECLSVALSNLSLLSLLYFVPMWCYFAGSLIPMNELFSNSSNLTCSMAGYFKNSCITIFLDQYHKLNMGLKNHLLTRGNSKKSDFAWTRILSASWSWSISSPALFFRHPTFFAQCACFLHANLNQHADANMCTNSRMLTPQHRHVQVHVQCARRRGIAHAHVQVSVDSVRAGRRFRCQSFRLFKTRYDFQFSL